MKVHLDATATALATHYALDRDRLLADLARAVERGRYTLQIPLMSEPSFRETLPMQPVSPPVLRFELCGGAHDGPVFTARAEGDVSSVVTAPENEARGRRVSDAAARLARGERPTPEEALAACDGDEVSARRMLAVYDRLKGE